MSLKFVSRDAIDDMSALVQVMAFRRTGDKPLSGPVMIRFTVAFKHHQASVI